jgi:hypothetical protein
MKRKKSHWRIYLCVSVCLCELKRFRKIDEIEWMDGYIKIDLFQTCINSFETFHTNNVRDFYNDQQKSHDCSLVQII